MDTIKKRILVVDDEEDLRELVGDILIDAGYEVLRAGCGRDAIAMLRDQTVDLVLSDMRMPNGDGLFILNQLRADHPSFPAVILITGFSDVTKLDGANGVINKPFRSDQLLSQVQSCLATAGVPA